MERMLGRIKLHRGDNSESKKKGGQQQKTTPTEPGPAAEVEGESESCVETVNQPAISVGGKNFQWCDFLAGAGACGGDDAGSGAVVEVGGEQLIDNIPVADSDHVLSGARKCGRRFMRVFSDNLHNYYVDLLDSKHMMEFRARALKRRLCRGMRRGQQDNQLYRSNSFKFERFERKDDGNGDKQVSLCDDYSFPVDLVVKRRPLSACCDSHWPPGADLVEIIDTYSDPRDSKAYLVPGDERIGKVYTSPDREYVHPYADGPEAAGTSAKPSTCKSHKSKTSRETREERHARKAEARDKESRNKEVKNKEAGAKSENSQTTVEDQADEGAVADFGHLTTSFKCPYYYGDLVEGFRDPSAKNSSKKRSGNRRYRKSKSADSPQREAATGAPPLPPRAVAVPVRALSDGDCDGMVVTAHDAGTDAGFDDDDDMSRRRLYETAFDSRPASLTPTASPAPDEVTQHAILSVLTPKNDGNLSGPSSDSLLSAAISGLQLEADGNQGSSERRRRPLRGFSPAPPPSAPASAPLPAKFHGSRSLSSTRSAPHLTGREPSRRSCVLDLKGRTADGGNAAADGDADAESSDAQADRREREEPHKSSEDAFRQKVVERPRALFVRESAPIFEFKGRPSKSRTASRPPPTAATTGRARYSSTESMATSSSGGSLESVRSSTSDGERSSSSDGRPGSSSLSSHSEDSAIPSSGISPAAARFFQHANTKLHILSPISDKSSLEPCSETSTSDNNRNNNSQRPSPEADITTAVGGNVGPTSATTPTNAVSPSGNNPDSGSFGKARRRTPQNRNIIHLGLDFQKIGDQEIPGSDSGISVDGGNAAQNWGNNSDLNGLPFDMPKLRRRRAMAPPPPSMADTTTTTSGSATSVDASSGCGASGGLGANLDDLPFDMPKLRRKMRTASSESSSDGHPPPNMFSVGPQVSLNLGNNCSGSQRSRPGLNLSFAPHVTAAPSTHIDTNLPLERQGWYLGAISRLEAERVLRAAGEGSYLVRNSESTRQDFSLSLKSARGFMHMRIQRDELGRFILGQFSRPFDSVPEMIRHFALNRLPIRGAEHMCLVHPVLEPLL